MIKLFNGNKLTRQPFFMALVAFLDETESPTLRQIKAAFPDVEHLDKQLDSYVEAGYIKRENKRYQLQLPLLEDVSTVTLDDQVFVDTASPLYEALRQISFETRLTNQTNAAVIVEQTSISRDELTLANYFYKLAKAEPLSEKQKPLYAILGDVNPEYALKYLTTFLLKFERKEIVMQKRSDIFVDSLVLLGYLKAIEPTAYRLTMAFDNEAMQFVA